MHSESCVLFLLSAWVNREERPACSPEQMEQLVRNVRVEHLSSTYLHCVLPDLKWFQAHIAGLETSIRAVIMKRTVPPASRGPSYVGWKGPPAWIASKRTRSEMPVVTAITVGLGPEEIQRLDASAPHYDNICSSTDDHAYLNGICFGLQAFKNEDEHVMPKVSLGLLLEVVEDVMVTALGCWGEGQLAVVRAELWTGPKLSPSCTYPSDRIVCLTANALGRSSAATVAEAATPFLVDGRLTLKAVIKEA